MDPLNITVVGGAGIVGREFLKILDERKVPVGRLRLLATSRSAGKRIEFRGSQITIEETTEGSFDGKDDIVFLSASGSASKLYAPIAAEKGALVIDDSSAFRMDETVPLVIPEINADDLAWHRGIISQPNCTTTPMALALYPIHQVNPLKRIVVATYQAVAGAGAAAIEGLKSETAAALEGRHEPSGTQKKEIAFNAVPQVDDFSDDGYTKEELKMANETRKILHAPELAISATCVRVPTMFGHGAAIWQQDQRRGAAGRQLRPCDARPTACVAVLETSPADFASRLGASPQRTTSKWPTAPTTKDPAARSRATSAPSPSPTR